MLYIHCTSSYIFVLIITCWIYTSYKRSTFHTPTHRKSPQHNGTAMYKKSPQPNRKSPQRERKEERKGKKRTEKKRNKKKRKEKKEKKRNGNQSKGKNEKERKKKQERKGERNKHTKNIICYWLLLWCFLRTAQYRVQMQNGEIEV